jgi:hypothetical protein
MAILYTTGPEVIKYPTKHDPDEMIYYGFRLAPEEHYLNFAYYLEDVIKPTTSNGFYYICIKPGISGTVEPAWNTVINGKTIDGSVTWKAIPYDFIVKPGDTVSSTWITPNDIVLDNPGNDSSKTWVRVSAITDTALTSFIITNRVEITRLDGKEESYDRTLSVAIKR